MSTRSPRLHCIHSLSLLSPCIHLHSTPSPHTNKITKMNKAVVCVMVLALLCTATYAQNPLTAISDAAKKVTETVDKAVNGTKNAASSVTNGTKAAVDGVKNATDAIGSIGKKSAAGYSAPAVGVFAAAGFGSLLLLAL